MCNNKIPYKEEPCVIPFYREDIEIIEPIRRIIIVDDDEEESDSENYDDE